MVPTNGVASARKPRTATPPPKKKGEQISPNRKSASSSKDGQNKTDQAKATQVAAQVATPTPAVPSRWAFYRHNLFVLLQWIALIAIAVAIWQRYGSSIKQNLPEVSYDFFSEIYQQAKVFIKHSASMVVSFSRNAGNVALVQWNHAVKTLSEVSRDDIESLPWQSIGLATGSLVCGSVALLGMKQFIVSRRSKTV